MNQRRKDLMQTERNKLRMERSTFFFNLGFVFVKVIFFGTLFVAFIAATILQMPEEKGICIVFLFVMPMAVCMCLCFIISDLLLKKWLMPIFWAYGAICFIHILIKSVILEILKW